jgi:hypothetical protein
MEKKLMMLANVLIIVVALAIGVQLVRGRMIAGSNGGQQRPNPTALQGKKFPVNENWSPYDRTVVLALQVGCHFCSESAPFYSRLSKLASERGINVVAMMPNPESDSKAYLNGLSVKIGTVRQVNFGDIAVSGTPTLFVVDRRGVVQQVWEGKLQENQEQRVLALLDQKT